MDISWIDTAADGCIEVHPHFLFWCFLFTLPSCCSRGRAVCLLESMMMMMKIVIMLCTRRWRTKVVIVMIIMLDNIFFFYYCNCDRFSSSRDSQNATTPPQTHIFYYGQSTRPLCRTISSGCVSTCYDKQTRNRTSMEDRGGGGD